MKKFLSYFVFWLLQCTWGIIMNIAGGLVALALLITGHKPRHLGPVVYFEVGNNWGGLELGAFFLCCKEPGDALKLHECGHAIQNIIFGPLFPFIVFIPSATRYWFREMRTHKTKAIFTLLYFIISVGALTGLIALFAHLHLVILLRICEALRIYFALVALWLSLIEGPRYKKKKYYDYHDIWFEHQADVFGNKYFN